MENLDGSIWIDSDGDEIRVEVRRDGSVYLISDSWDATRPNAREARELLARYGAERIGYES